MRQDKHHHGVTHSSCDLQQLCLWSTFGIKPHCKWGKKKVWQEIIPCLRLSLRIDSKALASSPSLTWHLHTVPSGLHAPALVLSVPNFSRLSGAVSCTSSFFFSFVFFTSLIPVCLHVEGNNVTQTEEMWTAKSPPSGWLADWLARLHTLTDSPTHTLPPHPHPPARRRHLWESSYECGRADEKKKDSAASRTFTLLSFHSNKRALTGLEPGWLSQPSQPPPHSLFFLCQPRHDLHFTLSSVADGRLPLRPGGHLAGAHAQEQRY